MAYTFVLVHGAWHGGWCWQRVADRLRGGGHTVFTPTLTGLGERSHLLRAGIDLDTHITDVVNVMKWEGLSDVVLCGHSYGGFVISGVAEQMAPAIRSHRVPRRFRAAQRRERAGPDRARRAGGHPQRAATRRYRDPAAGRGSLRRQRSRPRLGGSSVRRQPIATFTDKIALTGARDRIARKSYIRAKSYANPGFDRALGEVRSDPSWRSYEVPSGHDVMVDMPERLTEILLEVAQ